MTSIVACFVQGQEGLFQAPLSIEDSITQVDFSEITPRNLGTCKIHFCENFTTTSLEGLQFIESLFARDISLFLQRRVYVKSKLVYARMYAVRLTAFTPPAHVLNMTTIYYNVEGSIQSAMPLDPTQPLPGDRPVPPVAIPEEGTPA